MVPDYPWIWRDAGSTRPTQCGKPCHKPAMGMVQMAVLTHPHLKKKDRADLEHPSDLATAAMEETLKAAAGVNCSDHAAFNKNYV